MCLSRIGIQSQGPLKGVRSLIEHPHAAQRSAEQTVCLTVVFVLLDDSETALTAGIGVTRLEIALSLIEQGFMFVLHVLCPRFAASVL